MKRAGGLFEKLISIDNLQLAFWKAQHGKSGKFDVIAYRERLNQNLYDMRSNLIDGSFPIGCYHYFTVNDPKERNICAASFPERVMHHALMNVCEPVFERYAILDSYACRKRKGSLLAVKRAYGFAGKSSAYLKLDIARYFDSIDHKILFERLERLFKEKRILELFDRIINSYETAAGRGLPIGNLTSQHFANYFIGFLDHHVKEILHCRKYIRYMDDFIIFSESKPELKELLKRVREFLNDKLKLELNPNIFLNFTASGFNFLGYRIFPDIVRLSKRSKRRFIKKFKNYEYKYKIGEWREDELARHMEPLIAFTKNASAEKFRKSVIYKYGAAASNGHEPRESRRQLEQQRRQLPLGQSQQQQPVEQEQQQRLSSRPFRSSTG